MQNLIGRKFGKLLVVSLSERIDCKKSKWLCKCDCGNVKIATSESLVGGRTKSCGCLRSLSKIGKWTVYKDTREFSSLIEAINHNYEITKTGKVINRRTNKEMLPGKDAKGYLRIRLYVGNLSSNKFGFKTFKVHRLVALFYVDNYSDDLQVNHIDGNKENNNAANLEMVTNQENVIHAWRILDSTKRKERLRESLSKYREKQKVVILRNE